MTMCNVFLAPGRAVMLSDTVSYRLPDEERMTAVEPSGLTGPKTALSTNRRFMIGGQGLTRINDEARSALASLPDIHTAADLARGLMEARWLSMLRSWEAQFIALAGLDEDGAAVGYSVSVTRHDRTVRVQRLPMGATLRPGPGDGARMPAVWTDEQMVRAAFWQCKGHLTFGLPMAVGGVIHMTEVTPAGGRQSVVGVSPDYGDLIEQFGNDPCAAEVAAWRLDRMAA